MVTPLPYSTKVLQEAINGESTAVEKYKKFRRQALEEGFKNIAYFLRALIAAEKIHIKNHKKALGNVDYLPQIGDVSYKSTLENIESGIEGELHETKKMYPYMIKKIKKETKEISGKVVKLSLQWAKDAEKEHAARLKAILEELKEGNEINIKNVYICPYCGNIEFTRPKVCDVCKHDGVFFKKLQRRQEENHSLQEEEVIH